MRPFETISEALAWLAAAPGFAVSISVRVRHHAVTLLYVDHEHGWMVERETLYIPGATLAA